MILTIYLRLRMSDITWARSDSSWASVSTAFGLGADAEPAADPAAAADFIAAFAFSAARFFTSVATLLALSLVALADATACLVVASAFFAAFFSSAFAVFFAASVSFFAF